MIPCSEVVSESLVLRNASTVLDIEDIGSMAILSDNLGIEFIAILSRSQVCIEGATDDAFIAQKDQAIAGPVIGIDVRSVEEK